MALGSDAPPGRGAWQSDFLLECSQVMLGWRRSPVPARVDKPVVVAVCTVQASGSSLRVTASGRSGGPTSDSASASAPAGVVAAPAARVCARLAHDCCGRGAAGSRGSRGHRMATGRIKLHFEAPSHDHDATMHVPMGATRPLWAAVRRGSGDDDASTGSRHLDPAAAHAGVATAPPRSVAQAVDAGGAVVPSSTVAVVLRATVGPSAVMWRVGDDNEYTYGSAFDMRHAANSICVHGSRAVPDPVLEQQCDGDAGGLDNGCSDGDDDDGEHDCGDVATVVLTTTRRRQGKRGRGGSRHVHFRDADGDDDDDVAPTARRVVTGGCSVPPTWRLRPHRAHQSNALAPVSSGVAAAAAVAGGDSASAGAYTGAGLATASSGGGGSGVAAAARDSSGGDNGDGGGGAGSCFAGALFSTPTPPVAMSAAAAAASAPTHRRRACVSPAASTWSRDVTSIATMVWVATPVPLPVTVTPTTVAFQPPSVPLPPTAAAATATAAAAAAAGGGSRYTAGSVGLSPLPSVRWSPMSGFSAVVATPPR